MTKVDRACGVVVCQHIAGDGANVGKATRSAPIAPEDSGWQFICNEVENEEKSFAAIWRVDELLEYDQTLETLIDLDIGTVLVRAPGTLYWQNIQ